MPLPAVILVYVEIDVLELFHRVGCWIARIESGLMNVFQGKKVWKSYNDRQDPAGWYSMRSLLVAGVPHCEGD